MHIYYYLYQITNLINGKIYVGVHKTTNLDDGYMGSGRNIKAAIEKYGIENFRKDILEMFDSLEEMFVREAEVVNQKFLERDDVYNIAPGGAIHGGELIARLGAQRCKELYTGGIIVNNGATQRILRPGEEIPDGFSRGLLISHLKGRITITDGTRNRKIPADAELPEGWYRGSTASYRNITNGTETRVISKEDPIPEGWRIGRSIRANAGGRWINNGVESTVLAAGLPIPEGWRAGRKPVDVKPVRICVTNGAKNLYISSLEDMPEGFSVGGGSKIYITDGTTDRLIFAGESIPEGWYAGQTRKKAWITNGVESRLVLASQELPAGWHRGRTH